jgi:hypothetical protein
MVHFVGDYSYFMWRMHGEDKVKMCEYCLIRQGN